MRDGEGATKFIEIVVDGGRDRGRKRKAVGYAIAHSPLVKTAFFASDPNLGRILGAIGNAGIGDLDVARIRLWLDDVLVADNGGRAPSYREEDGAARDEASRKSRCASISAAARPAPPSGPAISPTTT